MRITAGIAKNQEVITLKGKTTRPTKAIVREAIFNILYNKYENAKVLDVFAGSGVLSFEALSRGADKAVLIENNRKAVQIINSNGKKLNFSDKIKVIPLSWDKALNILKKQKEHFKIIFLDPPYDFMGQRHIFSSLLKAEILIPDTVIVYESQHDLESIEYPSFTLVNEKTYGESKISFFRLRN